MSLDYEKKKYKVLKAMADENKRYLLRNRDIALDMPIETDNGFNVERERLITEIDEKLEVIRRHEDEPYFAKLEFKDKDDGTEFKGYIGRLPLGEISDPTDNKVIDWRAPISDLYYNGRVGQSSYKANGRYYSVDLKLKRQIDIKEGEVRSIFDFQDTISNDEFLKPYLTQSADNRLKNIVATIQEEQDKIIRLPIFKNVVVQGVAGSGKTTVALHRISYLMYNYKNQVKPEEYLIISPNEIFMSYISSILTDLDAEKTSSFSLNKMSQDIIGSNYDIMPKHYQYKRLCDKKVPVDYLKYKGSRQFAHVIDKFLSDYMKGICSKDVVVDGVKILDGEYAYPYFCGAAHSMEVMMEYGCMKLARAIMYDEGLKKMIEENLSKADISIHKKFAIRRKCESGNTGYLKKTFVTQINLMELYKSFISNVDKYSDYKDIKILKKYTQENLRAGRISYDDLACILYMLYKTQPAPYYNSMKCVLIDEAQDLSELMYMALRGVFNNATFGIFGDIAQGIYAYQSIDNWRQVLDILDTPEMLYLKKCYRTSIEIMEEANKTLAILGTPPAQNVLRHGEAVDYVQGNSIVDIDRAVRYCNDRYAHTAVICKDDNELEIAQRELAELNLVVIDEHNLSYDNNKNVLLTVQTAKGLEFDSVIIYDRSNYDDKDMVDMRLLYVAQTRALHKLIICGVDGEK
ncbi:MAG: hypothetical protein E7361_03280 [Clostridiales bacterium]|nr:hypothetical protein [Clostridiales bacterium]